jgi:hypothetical protein
MSIFSSKTAIFKKFRACGAVFFWLKRQEFNKKILKKGDQGDYFNFLGKCAKKS